MDSQHDPTTPELIGCSLQQQTPKFLIEAGLLPHFRSIAKPGDHQRQSWHDVASIDASRTPEFDLPALRCLNAKQPNQVARVAAMPLQVVCPSCGNRLPVDESLIGKQIRCGGCQVVIEVPRPQSAPASSTRTAAPTATQTRPVAGTMEVVCTCRARLTVPVSAKGTQLRCPSCQNLIYVPSETAPTPPANSMGAGFPDLSAIGGPASRVRPLPASPQPQHFLSACAVNQTNQQQTDCAHGCPRSRGVIFADRRDVCLPVHQQSQPSNRRSHKRDSKGSGAGRSK